MTQIPSDEILESLYKLGIRESEKLKTVLELYNMEIHQKKAGHDYHRLKTMVKRSIEQNFRMKNFEASNGNYETSAVVKNQRAKQRGQGSGVPKACHQQAAVDSQGSRTCVCKHLFARVAHAGGEGRINVLQWYRPVGVAKTSSETQRRKSRAAQKGRVTATWYEDDSPHQSWKCAQVTGKAGENGQYSGEMGGSSPWTRPSAPGCGDTLKAPGGDQRLIRGGDRPRRRLRGRYRLGHRPVVLLRTETAQCTVRPT